MKKCMFASLIFCLFLACTAAEVAQPIDNTPQLPKAITVKDTTIVVKADKDIALPAIATNVDLGDLKPLGGGTLKYIALGSEITAGYRNGGLYREGQLTSFPNLLAHQMGIADFKQPLFSSEHGNGTGYQVFRTDHIANVTNNLGIRSSSPLLYDKYVGDVHNFGVPNSVIGTINSNFKDLATANSFYERLPKSDVSYSDMVSNIAVDFYTAEFGTNDYLKSMLSGGNTPIIGNYGVIYGITAITDLFKKNNTKGLITNIPNLISTPYFTHYTVADLKKQFNADVYIEAKGIQEKVRLATDKDVLLFKISETLGKVDANGQKKGFSPTNPFKDEEVLDESEAKYIKDELNLANLTINNYSKTKNNIPVVDLFTFYQDLQAGKLAVSYKDFYSSDMLYPSAKGQALIANEFIKVINASYNAKIPLIDLSTIK